MTAQVKRGTDIIQDVPIDGTMAIVGDINNVDVAEGRYFTDAEDPDGQVNVARVGNEAVDSTIEPGDAIKLEYLVGQVIKVTRVVPVA